MDNVNLSDQFEQPQGMFEFYDAYDEVTRLQIIDQRHIDIRVFKNASEQTDWRMLDLDQTTMDDLDLLEMEDLEAGRSFSNGEGWTNGDAEPQTDRNNWFGLSLTCAPGVTTTTESVIPITTIDDEIVVIDLLTEFENDDFISLALPDFPLGDINLTESWLDFTSHASGSFVSGPVASLRLDASTIALVDGDSEYRRLRSAITGIDIQHITGVRFRIKAINSCTFRAMALRLIGKDWAYTELDYDTRQHILKPTVAPNGSLTRPYDLTFPTLFRAGQPAGTHDPRPIDLSIAAAFFTGSKDHANTIRFFFREGPGDFTTQLDLDGKTMAELNGHIQPDINTESWRGRTQLELDRFTQTDLLGDTMTEIERTVDPEIASYLSVSLQWNPSSSAIALVDSEGNGHTFGDVAALEANTPHIFIVEVVGKTIRARVYPLDTSGNILVDEIVFDTSIVKDDFVFVRRAGRFGWTALFGDGDAYIENISTRRQVYAELQTAAYGSLTPVIGAELHIAGSEQLEFFDELNTANLLDSNVVLTRDRTRSTTGLSWRVANPGTVAPQGIQTNLADFYDFDEMEISFDLYYPSSALNANVNLEAYLSSNTGRVIPIPLGRILPDRWQTFKLSPGGRTAQTGRYSFYLVQTATGLPSTWWIDNVHIRERTLSFYARSVAADPWGDVDADWVPFKNTINLEHAGVQFLERGRSLQVLARGHRQSARIDNIKVVPQYAQLGNFVWEEDELYNPQSPTADFVATPSGLTIVFDGTGSTDLDGDIINYRWNFGDGSTATGPIVSYTYKHAGTYTPSLVVIDSNGLQDSSNETMFVTP